MRRRKLTARRRKLTRPRRIERQAKLQNRRKERSKQLTANVKPMKPRKSKLPMTRPSVKLTRGNCKRKRTPRRLHSNRRKTNSLKLSANAKPQLRLNARLRKKLLESRERPMKKLNVLESRRNWMQLMQH
jgi:hypothetical protein